MQYRKLGRTNLDVSVIGLGGLQFSVLSNVQAVRIIMRAGELGINLIDVGRAYKGSEEKTGFVMQKNRRRFYIATKTPYRNKEKALKDIDASLCALQTDYIDIYQLHQIDSYEALDTVLAPGGAFEALSFAREQGKIRYTGITGHSPAILAKAIQTGQFDVVQVLFNIVEREALSELIPLAMDMNIGILGMKPFGGGAFLEADNKLRKALDGYADAISDTLIRFVLSSEVSSVLAGVHTEKELEQNAAVGDPLKLFSASETAEILKAVDLSVEHNEVFCHRCGYCVCCPRRIDIPLIIRLDEYYNKYESKAWPVKTYQSIPDNAAKCIQCGLCEEKCPFHLPIRDMLRNAHKRLTSG